MIGWGSDWQTWYPQGSASPSLSRWDHAELGALVCNEWELPEEIAAAISTQNEPESELRPDPVFFVSDLSGEIDETWREHFKEGVLTHHDVSEEALDKMLDEADGKARELVRLIS